MLTLLLKEVKNQISYTTLWIRMRSYRCRKKFIFQALAPPRLLRLKPLFMYYQRYYYYPIFLLLTCFYMVNSIFNKCNKKNEKQQKILNVI